MLELGVCMRHRIAAALALLFLAVPSFAAVTGTVMTTDGAPIAGAKLTLLPIESVASRAARLVAGSAAPEPLASATSDTKGNFSVEASKEALSDLRIEAPGSEPQIVRVERDDDLGAIALRKAAARMGRVTANGKAVPNARVIWWGVQSQIVSMTMTDAEGRYTAPDPRGAVGVTVLHPDFAVSEELFLRRIESTTRVMDRTLVAGKPLTGRVVAADGETPVAKATIVLDGWPLATSADDGTFTIAHARSKWKMILATSPGSVAMRRSPSGEAVILRMAKAPSLRGTVRDAKTQGPLANAEVRVSLAQESFAWSSALSDAKGNYRLDLPTGAYRLSFIHPAYSPEMTDASIPAQGLTKDGRVTPLARVAGSVMDEEKRAVAGASLTPEDVTAEGMRRFFRQQLDVTYSGPDGRFVMRTPGDQDIRVRAVKKGFPEAKSDALHLAPAERKRGVIVTIPSGIAVNGRITDRDGNPLSGVAVTAAESENDGGGPVRRAIFLGAPSDDDQTVRTGSDGTFVIRLREGSYDLSFRREGYAAKTLRAHAVTIGAPPVETSLEPSVEISGRVVRSGAGIEGVSIFSFSPDQQSTATTGPDGSFTLADLVPGMTRITLRKEDELIMEQRNITAPGRDVVIELPLGGTISGRVVDKSTSKPVTSFQAGISTARSAGGMTMMSPPLLQSFTGDDGSFTLEHVPPGAVNLVVNAPGYATARKGGLNLEEGKALTDVEVEIDPGVKLVGRVTAPDGSPLSGVSVRPSPQAGGRMSVAMPFEARATTDASGEYVLEGQEAGEKTFEFSHSKYVATRKTTELRGRETRLDVKMEGGSKVTGSVVTEDGATVGEASVEAYSSSGMGRNAKTDAGGNFTMDTLPPGRYTFRATKAGYAQGKVDDVDVQAGAPVRIVLGRGSVVYGHVSGLTEADYANAEVEAFSSAGHASAAVDSSGNYRMEGAPSGSVRVSGSVSTRDFGSRKTSATTTVQLEPGGSQQVDIEFRTDIAIRGRVTRDGRPLTGGTVSFFPRGGGAQTVASVPADEQGMYVATGLQDGDYSVSVIDNQRLTPYQTTYQVHGSATFDIDYRTTTLRGRVFDAETGDPVENVVVVVRPSTRDGGFNSRNGTTDSAGNFVIDFLPAGSYTATAEKDGYGTEAKNLSVSESSAPDLEFRLTRSDGIALTVVDARDGRPVTPMIVATNAAGQVVYEPVFRGGGSPDVTKMSLPPGTYTVSVAGNGYAQQTFTMRSPSRQTVALTRGGTLIVVSHASQSLRLRLLDTNGVPYMYSPSRSFRNWMPLEPNSPSTYPNILAGTYKLQLLDDHDTLLKQTQITVSEGQTTTVDM
jgi:protocatechuate 3,4-dioxygenase beta subunit